MLVPRCHTSLLHFWKYTSVSSNESDMCAQDKASAKAMTFKAKV